MYGRNGFDKLCFAILWTSVILSVVNIFFRTYIIWILQDLLFVWCIFRALSKNIYKRQQENRRFMNVWNKIKGFFKLQKSRYRDRKTHIYRRFHHCKNTLRLPRRKGKHTVKCPKCGFRFDVKCQTSKKEG